MATIPFADVPGGSTSVAIATAGDEYVLPPVFSRVMAMRGYAMLSLAGGQAFSGHAVRLLWRPSAQSAWRGTGVALAADSCENIVLAPAGEYAVIASGGTGAPSVTVDVA